MKSKMKPNQIQTSTYQIRREADGSYTLLENDVETKTDTLQIILSYLRNKMLKDLKIV